MQNTPIILNCLTNLERSSLIAVTITCILALESGTPIIISKFHAHGNFFRLSIAMTSSIKTFIVVFFSIRFWNRCDRCLVPNLLTTEKYPKRYECIATIDANCAAMLP